MYLLLGIRSWRDLKAVVLPLVISCQLSGTGSNSSLHTFCLCCCMVACTCCQCSSFRIACDPRVVSDSLLWFQYHGQSLNCIASNSYGKSYNTTPLIRCTQCHASCALKGIWKAHLSMFIRQASDHPNLCKLLFEHTGYSCYKLCTQYV